MKLRGLIQKEANREANDEGVTVWETRRSRRGHVWDLRYSWAWLVLGFGVDAAYDPSGYLSFSISIGPFAAELRRQYIR